MSYPYQDKPYPGNMPARPPAYDDSTPPPAVMVQPGVTTIIAAPIVSHDPSNVTCPHCQAMVLTEVEYTPGSRTNLYALLLCLFGGCCCFWLPYTCDSCQNAVHRCPNCKQNLGICEG